MIVVNLYYDNIMHFEKHADRKYLLSLIFCLCSRVLLTKLWCNASTLWSIYAMAFVNCCMCQCLKYLLIETGMASLLAGRKNIKTINTAHIMSVSLNYLNIIILQISAIFFFILHLHRPKCLLSALHAF